MKNCYPLIFIISCLIFYECKEKSKEKPQPDLHNEPSISLNDSIPYKLLPIDSINNLLDSLGIFNLEKLARVYYSPNYSKEGNESYTIYSEKDKNPPRVTIIHDNLNDDSLRGIKFTLLIDENFNIIEIRQSIRCWPGRGRGYWHAGKCI